MHSIVLTLIVLFGVIGFSIGGPVNPEDYYWSDLQCSTDTECEALMPEDDDIHSF